MGEGSTDAEAGARCEDLESTQSEAGSADLVIRRSITIPEAGQILGLSRSASYRAAKAGDLATINVGSRLLVPVVWLEALLGEPLNLERDEAPIKGATPELSTSEEEKAST